MTTNQLLYLYSFVVVPIGLYLATEHWHESKIGKILRASAWTFIGIYVASVGAHFSTYYWNELSAAADRAQAEVDLEEKRVVTLRAVAAEIYKNRDNLAHPAFVSGPNPSFYPRCNTIALANALTSGLFIQNESDRQLYTYLYLLHGNLERINQLTTMTTESPLQLVPRSTEFRGGITRIREGSLQQMDKLNSLFKDQFKIEPAEQFFIE